MSAERLTDAVANLIAAAETVNREAMGTLDQLPWQDAVAILHTLRTVISEHVGPIDASLVRHIYLTGEHGETEMDGVGVVRITRSKERKEWASRGAVFDYVGAKIRANDGELPDPVQVADWVLEVAGIQYIRVTPLRAAGLESSDYCTEVPGKPSVQFR